MHSHTVCRKVARDREKLGGVEKLIFHRLCAKTSMAPKRLAKTERSLSEANCFAATKASTKIDVNMTRVGAGGARLDGACVH